MEKEPLVTVGVPTYNSERYIKECLDSILGQTYKNLEIIVSDNGSTDDTEKIVLSYSDSKIRFKRNSENIYCYGNYNVILGMSKGDLIAFYHSDDVYLPDMVEKEVKFLREHTQAAAVFTEAHEIDESGRMTAEKTFPRKFSEVDIIDFRKAYNGFLEYWDFLICPSGMFVKDIFTQVGYFKEERFFLKTQDSMWLELLNKHGMKKDMIFTANDLDMWLRIMQKRPVGIIHKKLMNYRVHSGQGSQEYGTNSSNFFIVMDYYAGYAEKEDIISGISWRKYEILKSVEEFASGQRALIKRNFKDAGKYYISFLKSKHFIRMCLSRENPARIIWACAAVCAIPLKCGPFMRAILVLLSAKKAEKKNERTFF